MDPPESHNFGLEELFPTSRGGAYDWLWNALSVLRLCGFPTKIDLRWPSLFWILLIMTDPDAPSPSEPSLREWVHWIVTDIPGDSNPIQGNEILPYVTLEPRLGIHRFVLLLFEQKGPLGMVEQPLSRSNFSTRAFAHQLDLGMPVATVYFNAQKEHPLNRKR